MLKLVLIRNVSKTDFICSVLITFFSSQAVIYSWTLFVEEEKNVDQKVIHKIIAHVHHFMVVKHFGVANA